MGDHAQPEGLGLGRQRARNVAETDEAEHAAGEPMDRNHGRHVPAPRLDQRVGQRNLPRQREQQRHGVIGNLLHAVVGHIRDGDAELGRGGNVDIVDAEAETADRLAPSELPQEVAGELGIGDEDGVGIAPHRQNVLGRCAVCDPQLGIDACQRRLRRIERGKRAIGNRDQGTGHGRLPGGGAVTFARLPD